MDSILTLLSYAFNITLVGSFLIFCFKCFEYKKKSESKNYIQSLNAKISIVRISLRAKIKKKSHKYRALFKTQVTAGDPVDLALTELIELKLESGEDFQRYFDLSKRLNSLLLSESARLGELTQDEKIDSIKKSDTFVAHDDFMGTDFKNELSIIRLIKDMVEISAMLNKRIEIYNEANLKTPMNKVSTLLFPSFVEVNRVFAGKKEIPDDSSEAS